MAIRGSGWQHTIVKYNFWIFIFSALSTSCTTTAPLKPFRYYEPTNDYHTVHLEINIDSARCPNWGTADLAVYNIVEDSGGESAHIYTEPFKVDLSKPKTHVRFLWPKGDIDQREHEAVICPFFGQEDSHFIRNEESCFSDETKIAPNMQMTVRQPECSKKNSPPVKHDPTCAPGAE